MANDTFGHAAGDEMISAVSKCIKDSFGDIAECFRMGGDEFLVAMNTKPDVVRARIERFDRFVSEWKGEYVETLTVSYGVVAASDYPDLDFEALLKTADDIMYQRKKQKPRRG